MAHVTSVDVWSEHTRSRRPQWGRSASSCLETAVDITSFIICWMGPTAKGALRWGSRIFGIHCRIMVTTKFNTHKWSGAIRFSMHVRLAPNALYYRFSSAALRRQSSCCISGDKKCSCRAVQDTQTIEAEGPCSVGDEC